MTAPSNESARTRWTPAHSAALARFPVVGLNFHKLSRANRPLAERQIRAALALGVPFDLDDDDAEPGVPRVLVGFYDGFATTGAWGAQLCHRLGLRAYFFPIFAPPHGRKPLSDDELADIATVHEIGLHTHSHAATAEIGPADVEREVRQPYERIHRLAGRAPRIAAWKGGTRFDPAAPGDQALRELGVTHLVSNWSVERLPEPGAGPANTG